MEEWVGIQWHRFITRAADGRDNPGAVRLEAVQRSIGLMFRAGGGAQAVRLAPANTTRVHNQRSLLQRIAGSATHAYLGQWQPDVLSLPRPSACLAMPSKTVPCTCGWPHWPHKPKPAAIGSPAKCRPPRRHCKPFRA